jgi:hypothetical protein
MKRYGRTTTSGVIIGLLIALALILAVIALTRYDATGRGGNRLGKEFVYNTSDLPKTDPNLILYEENASPIPTGFAQVFCVAVDAKGLVYVGGDQAIRCFGRGGKQVAEIALGQAPTCLAVAEDGRLFVGLRDHVEVFDDQLKPSASWETRGGSAVLTSIALSDAQVFVADAGNRVVLRYDQAGTMEAVIGEKDAERNIPGFIVPSPYFDMAVTGDGLFRVVNPGRQRIEAYTLAGDFEFAWGKPSTAVDGFCGCCNPVNIALLSDGSFVTCEKGLVRVKVYDSDGAFVGVVAGPEQLMGGVVPKVCETPAQCQEGGFDVAVDAQDRVYVLDALKNTVRIFTRKGTAL